MRVFERILCPVDFSEFSVRALQWTEYLSRKFNSEVIILHVTESIPALADLGFDYDKYRAGITQRLSEFLEPVKIKYETVLSTGDPSQKIVALSKGLNASLIVMGTQGLKGAAHRLIGSVTETVVRNSYIPVMTISPKCSFPNPKESKRVLVPVSSSEHLPPGYVRLRRILRELEASINLMHVVELSDPMFDASFQANPLHVTTFEITEKEKQLLKNAAPLMKYRSVLNPVPSLKFGNEMNALVRFGDPAEEILKQIQDDAGYDYVLMEAKKKTLLYRFAGSTVYKVISQANIPVITLRIG